MTVERQELHNLARKMVFLDKVAALAARRGETLQASEFLAMREEVATTRSHLIRHTGRRNHMFDPDFEEG